MKFADKYEILEMVTSGRVTTFLARERTTQEAVVVYTFECAGSGARDLSTATIIARFCAVAPNPPGMIVKAGFDEPSSAAFLTTKMPDPVALKAWISAYHSYGKNASDINAGKRPAAVPAGDETAELSASEVRAVLARTGRPPKLPPVENVSDDPGTGTAAFPLRAPEPAKPQAAGDFTRLFQEVNAFQRPPGSNPTAPASPKPANTVDARFGEVLGDSRLGGGTVSPPPAAPKATRVPAETPPGSFTREFLGIPAEQAASTPVAPRSAVPSEHEPGAFTREFLGISQEKLRSGDSANVGAPAPPKPAASPVTSFESIFGSPSSSSSSPQSGGGAAEPKGGTGEFTSFFRDPFQSPGAPKPSEIPDFDSVAPRKPAAGDFTKMFGPGDIGRQEPVPMQMPDSDAPMAPGSFTEIFRSPSSDPSQNPPQSPQGSGGRLGTSPDAPSSFLDSGVGAPTFDPAPSPVPPRRDVLSPPAPSSDPFFSRPPEPAIPPMNPPFPNADVSTVEKTPGGPSEFTVFISRSQLNASLASEPAAASANPGGNAQRSSFAPPPIPEPAFNFAPPPPPPAVKLPAAPPPPAVPAAAPAPKPGGFWPLVVVLTLLLAVAGLLVMYYLLKH